MKIAIQGHPTRGKEVIQILESLGGKNVEKLTGTYESFYYIDDRNEISDNHKEKFPLAYKLYTLEKFEEEFPFKIEDIVRDCSDNKIGIILGFIDNDGELMYVVNFEKSGHVNMPVEKLKPCKEMQKRNITLTIDKAKEWYKKGGELREIALQAFSEKELNPLPRSWEEYCKNYPIKPEEVFIDGYSKFIVNNVGDRNPVHDKNICPSRKSAEAHLAMIQLEQLRNCWWDDWKPIWGISQKWCIRLFNGVPSVEITTNISKFLTFPTRKMAEEFLECFRDLIEKARDLI